MIKTLPSLLLLPPPPLPITPTSFSAAYRPSITAAILALKDLESSSQLFVVLPSPSLHGRLDLPRSQIYGEVQSVVGSLYSLICLVCANLGVEVDTDTPGSVDARVILVDYEVSERSLANSSVPDPFVAGPIVDLDTLSTARREWSFIFSVDGEQGQEFLRRYSNLTDSKPPLRGQPRVLPGGVHMIQPPTGVPSLSTNIACHSVVAVGGTFDHIHAGHKLLLTATAVLLQPTSQGLLNYRRLIVGITGDELLKNKKYAEYLNSWKQRQEDVVDFLLSVMLFTHPGFHGATETTSYNEDKPNGRAIHTKLISSLITIECVEIQDPFGPTITDESITALVVSGETRSGGKAVNDKRVEKGWNRLEVFEVDVLDAVEPGDVSANTADFASKISSTAIRRRKAENARTSSL